jgi:nitrate/nitrite-specific signal transduction histidine kinase
MLDRAEQLGAELTIKGRREGGTRVTLVVGVNERERRSQR